MVDAGDSRFVLPTWLSHADGASSPDSFTSPDGFEPPSDDQFSPSAYYSPAGISPELLWSQGQLPETAAAGDVLAAQHVYEFGFVEQPQGQGARSTRPPKSRSTITKIEEEDDGRVPELSTTSTNVSTSRGSTSRSNSKDASAKARSSGRHKKSSTSSSSSASSRKAARPAEVDDKRTARANHNQVEKKYRNRLNDHFERLYSTVQAARDEEGSAGADDDARTLSKAQVLDLARRRILALEKENMSLGSKVERLRSNMAGVPLRGISRWPTAV